MNGPGRTTSLGINCPVPQIRPRNLVGFFRGGGFAGGLVLVFFAAVNLLPPFVSSPLVAQQRNDYVSPFQNPPPDGQPPLSMPTFQPNLVFPNDPAVPGAVPRAVHPVPGQLISTATPIQQPAGQPPVSAQPPTEPPTAAQSGPPPTAAIAAPGAPGSQLGTQITAESIQAQLDSLKTSTDIDPKLKEKIQPLFEQALSAMKTRAESEKLQQFWIDRVQAAPASTIAAKQRKESPTARPTTAYDRWAGLETLQARLQELQTQTQSATTRREARDQEIASREKRRKDFPKLISDTKAELDQVNKALATPATDGLDPLAVEASRVKLETQRAALTESLKAIELEQRAYEAEAELLPLLREEDKAEEAYLQKQVAELQKEIGGRRESTIARKASRIREQVLPKLPEPLKVWGEDLVAKVDQWAKLAQKKMELQQELDVSEQVLTEWDERFTRMSNRITPKPGEEVGGFNSWVGLMLRQQRTLLPDPAQLRMDLRNYQIEMREFDSTIFELDDWLAMYSSSEDPEELLRRELIVPSNALLGLDDEQATELVSLKKEVIEDLRQDADRYITQLIELGDVKENTLTLVYNYRDFIDKQILWIRSTEPFRQSDITNAWAAFQYIVNYDNWSKVGMFILADWQSRPQIALLQLLLLLSFFFLSRVRRKIGQAGELAIKRSQTSFRPTIHATLYTLLASAPIPATLALIGWRLNGALESEEFIRSLSLGCLAAARFFLPLEILRQVCRPNGLGLQHFMWPKRVTDLLRFNLRWLIDLAIPAVWIAALLHSQTSVKHEASLGRIAFVTVMVLLSVFLCRVMWPKSGVLSDYLESHKGSWAHQLRYIWYAAVCSIAVVLAIISLVGYHYTAQRLAVHVHSSLWLMVGLFLVFCLLQRWLLLNRRKLMIAQAKQRLAEAAKRDPNNFNPPAIEEPELDLMAINEQTLRMVTSILFVIALVGVAFIWSTTFPAIGMLDYKLWTVQGDTPDEVVPITLASLLTTLPIVVLLVVAARNLPGLLEIAILQHLPISNAARYAISTLSRYAIIFIGLIWVTVIIGLRWDSIQWLVAALSVGLGFGLQEIFANFISGIILLFEQPIRVGDVITIGDTTGMVSRIRMRATTITNWDRQELIIPNKDLVTGRLLNWTLSDSTNRIILNVGVAYGTDTEHACKILRDICESQPQLLKEPAPVITFESFGDSSLKIVIRAFLSALDVRLQTTHELHTRIHQAFNQAGIEIAFPQRDLHVRSLPPELLGSFRTNAYADNGSK